ncbi:SDR family oxidoreductase [Variovorax paradoxus]|uniref:UDP-glucose 4-epimerase family protein n=1 Tax=Variovorax paradoxus TaxID=34073 RepID=UPI001D5C8532|nr:SDR family oxidoreductase [Polaromonas sp.]
MEAQIESGATLRAKRNRTLITGATGFVGQAVVRRILADPSHEVVAPSRRAAAWDDERVRPLCVPDFVTFDRWGDALADVDSVVHCAARVHVMNDEAIDPLTEFRRVNVQGTLTLASQAAAAGVRRFVFISSVKVNGESTRAGSPFTAEQVPAPQDAYGISKQEAEEGLRELSQTTSMEIVVIRPPLVYGPGVKANFASMTRWLRRGVPLPLGAIVNQRSLVALDNLVDLVALALVHPNAAGQTFMVSDGEDVSTTELLHRTAAALGKRARLLPVPMSWLEMAAAVLGKRAVAQRLCGSLQVDISKTCELLGWRPPVSLDEALRKAMRSTA